MEPFERYRLFPSYKANRRKSRPVRIERRVVEKPELTFSAPIPAEFTLGLAEGPTGIIGVSVEIVGSSYHLRAKGAGRDWILGKVAEFIRTIVPPGYWTRKPITGILSCEAHPGATVSGPMAPGWQESVTIDVISGDRVVVMSKSAMRPLICGLR